MFDVSRELIAYGLIGLVAAILAPWLGRMVVKRRRERLRRRGIKRYGH